jgi:hypothetical protein
MQYALVIVFYALSGALLLALLWIIVPFTFRLYRDLYRSVRDRKRPNQDIEGAP